MGEVKPFRRARVENEEIMHYLLTQDKYQTEFQDYQLKMLQELNDGIRRLGNEIRVKQRYSATSNIRSMMRELHDHALTLKEEFSDLRNRLYRLVQIKLMLKKLYDYTDQLDDHKHLHRMVIMLYDALRKVEAEAIVEEQVDAINKICRLITKMNVTEKDVDRVDDILLEAELDWVMGG